MADRANSSSIRRLTPFRQPGQLGNAKKGSLKGPGTWVVNFGFYKDVIAQGDFRLQFSALLDNAFNHPQFFPTYGSGFVDLTLVLDRRGSGKRRQQVCWGPGP